MNSLLVYGSEICMSTIHNSGLNYLCGIMTMSHQLACMLNITSAGECKVFCTGIMYSVHRGVIQDLVRNDQSLTVLEGKCRINGEGQIKSTMQARNEAWAQESSWD